MEPLEIIYEDDYFVAINKPFALLVHRTKISEDKVFALQLLRNQIKQRVYPVHRLDRPTSGVLLFAKSSEAAQKMGRLFQDHLISKRYLAIVRGFVEEKGKVDYALQSEKGRERQNALTYYLKLNQSEMPFAIGKRYNTARFSLVEVVPKTGRTHQIRKHFSHLRHPIIGDVRHGDVKQNKYFKQELGIERMLLHAQEVSFIHPYTEKEISINADLEEQFLLAINILKL